MKFFIYSQLKKWFKAASIVCGRTGACCTRRFYMISILLLFTVVQAFAQITVAPPTQKTRNINEDVTLLVGSSAPGSANNLLTGVSTTTSGATLTVASFTVNGTTTTAGTPFTITDVGTVTINANGSYTFDNVSNYNGPVPVITINITDGTVTNSQRTLQITQNPVDDCADIDTPSLGVIEDQQLVFIGTVTGTNQPWPYSIFDPDQVDGTQAPGTQYAIVIQFTNPNNLPIERHGFITATSANGVTVTNSGTDSVAFQGTYDAINSYFANPATAPVYTPPVDYNTQSPCASIGMFINRSFQIGRPGGSTGGACDQQGRNLVIIAQADAFNYTVNACTDRATSFNVLTATNTVNGRPSSFETTGGVTITAINGAAYTSPVTLTNGQLTVNPNGDMTFTPNAGWTGNQTFTYTVTPGTTGCPETRTVTLSPTTGCAPLDVTFDALEASLKDNTLTVSWATLKETNNDYFEVQASADGQKFTTLGTVRSKADASGNSDTRLEYSFIETTTGQAAMAGVMALSLALGAIAYKRRKNLSVLALLAALMGAATLYTSCNKNNMDAGDKGNQKVFVRISQTDKDGTKTYSRIVQAVSH